MPSTTTEQKTQVQTLEIGADGQPRSMPAPSATLLRRFPPKRPYRLYRFLSDLDDLVDAVKSDRDRLRIAAVLVRRLLNQSDWILDACPIPEPTLGWGVSFLYDEPGYPFTVQVVSWLPGQSSPIHNHATWSIVTLLGNPETAGHEENRLWRRDDQNPLPGPAKISQASEIILKPGDLIGFMPEAIHSVRAIPATVEDPQPTYTFNVYGITDLSQRVEFDPETETAVNF